MKILRCLIAFSLLIAIHACHVSRFIYFNFADVHDYKKSPAVHVSNDPDNIFRFSKSETTNHFDTLHLPAGLSEKSVTLSDYHKESKTTGFLIIRNDTILYENYFGGKEDKILTSFSVAKSFISALIGIAVDEDKIRSADDPMTGYLDYWPENSEFSKITIAHLLDMKSGIQYVENYYNPFGDVAKYYYGRHLEKYIKDIVIAKEPGEKYEYISVNTLLLSMILEKATGMPTCTYLEQKIWKPLEMEFNASMNKDRRNGIVKAFTGLNARLRDYAKFGRLYLHWGKWNGRQIISEEWIERVRNARPEEGKRFKYADQWRVGKHGDFVAAGHLGQFIYVFPDKNLIMVRTGKKSERWLYLLQQLAISNHL
jgi:CubicO group peptidase (beta-lactamase class C family)